MSSVLDVLTNHNKWTQGATARDNDDNVVGFDEENATKFCLFGAILVAYEEFDDFSHVSTKEKICKRVVAELKKKTGDKDMTIHKWNDHKDRKFSDIKALCRELDI